MADKMDSVSRSSSNAAGNETISPTLLNGSLACIYCPKTFMIQESLERHIKRNHSGTNSTENVKTSNKVTDTSTCTAISTKQADEVAATNNTLSTDNRSTKLVLPNNQSNVSKKHSSDVFVEPQNKKIKTSFRTGIRCLYCPYNHPSINAVRAHITMAHSREVDKPKGVTKDEYLKKVSQFALKCTKDTNCNFATHSLQLLKSHHMQKHTKTFFPCPLCIKKFTRHPDLTKHILMDHSGVPKRTQTSITSWITLNANKKSNSLTIAQDNTTSNIKDSSQKLPSPTNEYPFDFDFLKAYLKIFSFVKNIVDTTDDPQLKAEILKKDKHNLLRSNEQPIVLTSSNDALQSDFPVQTSMPEISGETQENICQKLTFIPKSPDLPDSSGDFQSLPNQDLRTIHPVDEAIEKIKSIPGMQVIPIENNLTNEAKTTVFSSDNDGDLATEKEEIKPDDNLVPSKIAKRMTAKQFRSSRRSMTPIPNV